MKLLWLAEWAVPLAIGGAALTGIIYWVTR